CDAHPARGGTKSERVELVLHESTLPGFELPRPRRLDQRAQSVSGLFEVIFHVAGDELRRAKRVFGRNRARSGVELGQVRGHALDVLEFQVSGLESEVGSLRVW